jgi:purine-binding chemotaxis protein CheW
LSLLDLQLVVFRLGSQRYALPLAAVDRIIRAVEVTPLPGAPDAVLGLIDLQGRVLPVIDLRRRFGLPEREINPADHFLIARTARRAVALLIDEAHGIVERKQSAVTDAGHVACGLEQFQGVLELDAELVLIHDLEKFLSAADAHALDEAMERAG